MLLLSLLLSQYISLKKQKNSVKVKEKKRKEKIKTTATLIYCRSSSSSLLFIVDDGDVVLNKIDHISYTFQFLLVSTVTK